MSLVPLVASSACLIEPSSRFAGNESTAAEESGALETSGDEANNDGGSEQGEGCAPGTLDCDDEPGCEADAEDPLTCGSCEHSCEFAGQVYDCEEGECVGSPVLSSFPDTYIDAQDPNTTFGDNAQLHVRGGDNAEQTFIALPPLPPDAQVLDAQLILSCNGPDLPATFDVYRVMGEWSEEELVWNDPPPISMLPVHSFLATEDEETRVDLNGLADNWPAPRGISIRDDFGMQHVTCSSKEGDTPPRLELDLRW